MAAFSTERELLAALRRRLDDWVYLARSDAYDELFEGDDALLDESDLELLDRLDSRLNRERDRGLWGADEYGILQTGTLEEESTPRVVCTFHPQIPEDAFPGEDTLDDETEERLNDALWEYCQRVVELVQHRLEEFVRSSEVATWAE